MRNFIDVGIYYLVRKDGSILRISNMENEYDNIEDLLEVLRTDLEDDRIVAIDEFQRLPMKIWDDISLMHPKGRLILSGSSFKMVDVILSKRSPLLGLFFPMKIPLIRPTDILVGLSKEMNMVDAIDLAPYMRDPWTIPLLAKAGTIEKIIPSLRFIAPGLVGEIFTEEQREISRTYSSIISLIGAGEQNYDVMGKVLHDRGIVSRPSSSSVIPYMKNMERMGLLTGYRVFKSRKTVYRLTSPVMKLYYYLDSRYDLEDREPSVEELSPTIRRLNDMAVEEFIADLMAEVIGGRVELMKDRDREIDIFITKRNKPVLVGEVKWGKSGKGDLLSFKEKVTDLYCKKIFFSRKKMGDDEITVVTPETLLEFLEELR